MLNIIHKQVAWLGIRQGLLAQNIANADKPSYKPLDMYEHAFNVKNKSNIKMRLSKTHIKHMNIGDNSPSSNGDDITKVGRQYKFIAQTYSSNSSSIEEQMQKMHRTNMEFKYAMSIYKRYRHCFDQVLKIGK